VDYDHPMFIRDDFSPLLFARTRGSSNLLCVLVLLVRSLSRAREEVVDGDGDPVLLRLLCPQRLTWEVDPIVTQKG
jgi:hypothetical protein